MRVYLHFTNCFLLSLALIVLHARHVCGANKESIGLSSSYRSKHLVDSKTIRPQVTLLPPDWNDDAKVNIPELGLIQGGANLTFPLLTLTTRKFYFFAGIPYAEPSSYTQENRFKPSKLWEGELPVDETGAFLATDFTIKCPQALSSKNTIGLADTVISTEEAQDYTATKKPANQLFEEQSEECLVININTPRIPACPTCELLPVIVFIHGGSFDRMWGGLYRGHRFLKKDVLFVSLNYRLGLLGSLNLGIDDAPGNAALYDIATALKWIKRYIGYFGGDKDSITLAGHSAGAVLATHFLTSDLAYEGDDLLVHRIIGLSGSSLSQTLATCTDPLRHHLRVSELAGCHNESDASPNFQAIRDCLAYKPTSELLEAMNKYTTSEVREGRFGLDAKLPSLQDKSISLSSMTETPYNILLQGKQNQDIAVMMGVTRHDGSYLVEQMLEQFWRPHNYVNDPIFLRNHLMHTLMEAFDLKDGSGELIHSMEAMYIGDAMYKDDFESKIPGLIDLFSVLAFKAGAYNLVELHSKKNPHSYFFSFEYRGICGADESQAIPKGVGHSDTLFYLFPSNQCLLILPQDLSVSNQFIDYWVNFATYGNPNGKGPKTIAAPYNPLNHAYLVMDGRLQDRTAYYCRDAWINNSIELIKESPQPSTSSSSTTDTETTTLDDSDVTTDISTTPEDTTSAATVNYVNSLLFIQLFGCMQILLMQN